MLVVVPETMQRDEETPLRSAIRRIGNERAMPGCQRGLAESFYHDAYQRRIFRAFHPGGVYC